MTIEEKRAEFEEKIGKEVPVNKKNDAEWIEKKIKEAKPASLSEQSEDKSDTEPQEVIDTPKVIKQPAKSTKKKELEEKIKDLATKYREVIKSVRFRNRPHHIRDNLEVEIKSLKEELRKL